VRRPRRHEPQPRPALDVAYAVKTLLYPSLKLTGFASHEEAVRNWQGAYAAIVKAGGDVKNGVPRILMVAALVDAPEQDQDLRRLDGPVGRPCLR
jgi:hypothetical protein